MEGQKCRRESPRRPVSFFVRCEQADLTEVGGNACDLSAGGIAFNTNCLTRVGEELTVELLLPNTSEIISVVGEVVWRQFHGDTADQQETLFTVGIKFLELTETCQNLICECIQSYKTSQFA